MIHQIIIQVGSIYEYVLTCYVIYLKLYQFWNTLFCFRSGNFSIWQLALHHEDAASSARDTSNVRSSYFYNHLRLFVIKIIQFGPNSSYVVSFYETYVQG